jgi:hypothetical protein
MIFNCTNNQTVEFRIVNYQFPDINDGDWDGNWLLIYLNVKSDLGNWQTTDPSLTTWDIQSLVDWFINLSSDKELEENPIEFLEPNLKFWFIRSESGKKKVKIKFDLESRPKSADDNTKYYVDAEWTNEELIIIATELKAELEKYPERKGVTE